MHSSVAIVVGIYFLALLGWNLYKFIGSSKNGSDNAESLYVGQRNYGTGALIATLVAVYASNYTLLAAAESGFRYGLSGPVWYALGVALPCFLFVWPVNLISRMRRAVPRAVTLIEYFDTRYDEKTRWIALVTILLANVVYIISVVVAIGIVLASLLGIDAHIASLIGGGVLILYTALGGYEGTVRSHVYQLIIAGLAVAISLILTASRIGLPDFIAALAPVKLDVLAWGPPRMLDFLLTLSALAVANPILWQRMFSARDTRSAARGMIGFPLLWIPFALGSGLMGMVAFQLLPTIAPAEAATRLVVDLFPAWGAVIFLLGGLALVFSTGDAAINNIASIVQFDLIRRHLKRSLSARQNLYLSFGLQIALGVIGIVGALGVSSILHLLIVNSAIHIALALPLFLGLIWPAARASAAFWSMLLSLIVGGAMTLAGVGPVGNLVGLLVSAAILIGGSWRFSERGARAPVISAAVVLGYTAMFLLARAYPHAGWAWPAWTVYPLFAYAVGGCLALALILPLIALKAERRLAPRPAQSLPDATGKVEPPPRSTRYGR